MSFDRTVKVMKRFGRKLLYKGNKTQHALLHHFNCSGKLLTSEIEEGDYSEPAMISKAFLFHQNGKPIVKYQGLGDLPGCEDEVGPLQITSSEKVGLDLDNALFDRKAFWALPVIRLNPFESLLWSQLVFQSLEVTNEMLLISQITIAPDIETMESTHIKVKSIISELLKGDFSNSSKSLISSPSILYGILQEVVKTLELPSSTQRELLSWLAYIKTSMEQKNETLMHGNAQPGSVHMKNGEFIQNLYNETCFSHRPHINVTNPWIQFRSIVLVVLFNFPYYDVIPYLELLYRPFFPQIVYCLPKSGNRTAIEKYDLNITIVEYDDAPGGGSTNYICVYHIQKLGLQAKGYFFAADDTFISRTTFEELPFHLPATVHRLPLFCDMCNTSYNGYRCDEWVHTEHATNELRSLNRKYQNQTMSLPHKCLQNLQNMMYVIRRTFNF